MLGGAECVTAERRYDSHITCASQQSLVSKRYFLLAVKDHIKLKKLMQMVV